VSQTLSILGAGWLGLPLAIEMKQAGYCVHASSRREETLDTLKAAGIHATHIQVDDSISGLQNKAFFESDTLIITLPFKRTFEDPSIYLDQIKTVIRHWQQFRPKHLLFCSSTSIYNRTNALVDEHTIITPNTERQRVLKEVEDFLNAEPNFECSIIRFAGLYGYDRQIKHFMTKSKQSAKKPVNLIHRDDAVGIMKALIVQNKWGELINAVSSEHPSRQDLYNYQAKQHGLTVPDFNNSDSAYKLVCNKKVKRLLQYQFKYDTPLGNYD